MLIKLKHIWNSNGLLKGATQLFSGMLPVFVLNFIFILIIERRFSDQEGLFSSFEAVRGILEIIIFTVGGVFSPAITRYVSVLKNDNREGDILPFIRQWIARLFLIGIILFIICIFFGDLIGSILQIDHTFIYLIGFILLGLLLQPIINGALIGLQEFSSWSTGMVYGACIRLILGVCIIFLFPDLKWALLGYGLGFFITVIYGFNRLRGNLNGIQKTKNALPKIKGYLGVSSLIFIAYAIFLRGDVIFVRALFDSGIADEFARVALLGHFVIFIPAAFTGAMMPKIAGDGVGLSSDQAILARTLFISAAMGILLALFLHFMGAYLFQFIFNSILSDEGTWWLRGIAWSMVPVCLLNSIMRYALMRKLFYRAVIIIVMAMIFIGLCIFKISSPVELILILFISSSIAAIFLISSIFCSFRNKRI